jgi:hypothetical protein
MTPLLGLELKRQRPMLFRMVALTAIVSATFYLAGKRTSADFLATLIGSSLGVVLIVPMGISRDKMEGTLDFLCGLPVESQEIAASRFVAVAILSVPWAMGVGALSFALPAPIPLNPAGVAILAWLALLMLGACATALLARFDLESLLGAPVVAIVIAVAVVPRAVRLLMPAITREAFMAFLRQPSAPLVLMFSFLAAAVVTGAAAFGITSRAFANYRPDSTRR